MSDDPTVPTTLPAQAPPAPARGATVSAAGDTVRLGAETVPLAPDLTRTAHAPGDEPTLPVVPQPAPASPPAPAALPKAPAPPPAPPMPVTRAAPQAPPDKWSGRVMVPGAAAPGQKKAPAPTAPTAMMTRVESAPARAGVPAPARAPARGGVPGRTASASPRPAPAPRRRRRGRLRRFLGALVALLLILAVPVVSAYVAYKLASGENPFQWPPTVDLSTVF